MPCLSSGTYQPLYILNQNHHGYLSSKDQTRQGHLLRPDHQPHHWFWLWIIKNINAEYALFTLSCIPRQLLGTPVLWLWGRLLHWPGKSWGLFQSSRGILDISIQEAECTRGEKFCLKLWLEGDQVCIYNIFLNISICTFMWSLSYCPKMLDNHCLFYLK